MHLLESVGLILVRLGFIAVFLLVLFVPAWWAAGRIEDREIPPFFRLLVATGIGLVGYISFVNLLGRFLRQSITAVLIYLALNAVIGVVLVSRRRAELSIASLRTTWREWTTPVVVALVLGIPQWLLAVSTNYFDEAASSAIHLSAPNQFAENLFPPRHNALPYLPIKYHYGFTILSGTVRWLTGLSANVSIDIVSTRLWLFVFLFVFFWFRKLDFTRIAAYWGSLTLLLGGGFAWLYLHRIEAYDGIDKFPASSALLHRYDPAASWLDNLLAGAGVPSQHLRNLDGTLSNLPWDIAAQFQQHAVSLGIALTAFALYLFATWQKRNDFNLPLLVANIITFSVLFLAHAVFGAVSMVTVSACLLALWIKHPTRARFIQGLCFGIGVPVLALMHGGLLAQGEKYGAGAVTTFRKTFGYSVGGLGGFIHWNLAGFGLPLLLAILTWIIRPWRRNAGSRERSIVFLALTVFAVFSYIVPQLTYYSSETIGVEQFTEISKFFFCTHFALALLSTFAVAWLTRKVHWAVVLPMFAMMIVTPLSFVYAGSFNTQHKWLGFYHAPYFPNSVEQQMGEALGRLKKTNHDVYFDASADERRHGYLGEMFVYAGSIFTLTPSRYERTGIGYRIAEPLVAGRLVQNSRMARLLPGAAEDCRCGWYYARPVEDMAFVPLLVRARFTKAVNEGYFRVRQQAGARALFSIDSPTKNLDQGIEKYWRPRVISQTHLVLNGAGKNNLAFFDYVAHRIIVGDRSIDLPESARSELVEVYTGKMNGDANPDFLVGRLKDTYFRLGKKIEDIVEMNNWGWSYYDYGTSAWQPEYDRWLWDWDVPLIADIDHSGIDQPIAYRFRTKEWLLGNDQRLNGPTVDAKELSYPFAGRFLTGSNADLGVWSLNTGMVNLKSLNTGKEISFKWGGRPGDVLVPGDYDGDGIDEIAVWQLANRTWYWRHLPDGPISQVTFGSETGYPLPADYNHDGRLDLAYWEPGQQKIFVSFTQGKSVDLVVPVPPHSIPVFVNMY